MARFRIKDIQQRILASIEQDPVVECKWHGLKREELFSHLVNPPRSVRFTRIDSVGFLWLWVVYDEHPLDPSHGYLVVYDPRSDRYGLARKPKGRKYGSFLGFSGSTLGEAVRSM
ncbi:MAG TPA: hypothetical protein VEF04_11280 [Blastocatellia bacterium]|nr:hypothetical protein [Blastocatellia bacterium]